jgi:hypothetical protein
MEYYHSGRSKSTRSKHLFTPSLAVDVAIWDPEKNQIDWDDGNKKNIYPYLACLVKDVAGAMDIPVEWGGDRKSIIDFVHWQLPAKSGPGRTFPPPENLTTATDIIGSLMADIENMENKLRNLQQILEANK